ncbi:MAG: DUF1622 domain-containing protein [Dethiobacter sp.]|nr:DUF1622 domain-containing protein [Dethiobacter sp.]MBS3899620.1 DUF1622 domain-containing protein [Dethiobacter sp.]MBS3982645.1 DUF1622 domain-containing protein [Dethiobacter sp.]MCL4463723.1 DUF1622 domain-containing protein [Bacillota bacterium]MCL5993893.1 DUF1622 domain-containing protein [Bacillota bacterium]
MPDLHAFERLMAELILLAAHLLEVFGTIIIFYAGVNTFLRFLRGKTENREVRLSFARFLLFGLEFKLASEILRTVIVRTLNEVFILAAIITLRAVLNIIIHWEIRQEKQDKD